jgi:hypothetical protein
VQRPLTSGPRGRSVGQVLRWFCPRLRGHVSTREEEGQGGEERRWKPFHPAGHVARPADHHLASYRIGQVGGAPPRRYKYPSTGRNQNTHHIFEIPLAKLQFLV